MYSGPDMLLNFIVVSMYAEDIFPFSKTLSSGGTLEIKCDVQRTVMHSER